MNAKVPQLLTGWKWNKYYLAAKLAKFFGLKFFGFFARHLCQRTPRQHLGCKGVF